MEKKKAKPKHYCDDCDYPTNKISNFKKHLLTEKHKNKIIIKNKNNVNNNIDKYKRVECTYCKKYMSNTNILRHQKVCKKKKIFDNKQLVKQITDKYENALKDKNEYNQILKEDYENKIKILQIELEEEKLKNAIIKKRKRKRINNKSAVFIINDDDVLENGLIKYKDKKGLFCYNKEIFESIIVNNNLWCNGKDIIKILKLKDFNGLLNNDKSKLIDLVNTDFENEKKNDIYINENGIISLLFETKKSIATKFLKWINTKVFPSIHKHGCYLTQKSNQYENMSFYKDNMISKFDNKNVLYIGYIGIINGNALFKFGISNRVYERDYKEHKLTFKRFDLIHVIESDNNVKIEKLFKKELTGRGLIKQLKINNKLQQELFAPNDTHSIKNVIDLLNNLVNTNELPIITKLKQQIKDLQINSNSI